MGQTYGKNYKVEGTVAPGYETVKEMFEENFRAGREENAQLCVYVGDEVVVDLWGYSSDTAYTGDTLTNVFSSTKSLTAICMAMLCDQGLIKYSDKIAKHWPEFGENGKEETTLADLMRHEAGLAAFDQSVEPEDLLKENIKNNTVGAVIANQTQSYPSTGKRAYHAVTRGWVANEIFRRVHPSGSTIGEHLRNMVSDSLNARVFIGTEDEMYSPVESMSLAFIFGQSLIPKFLGRSIDPNIAQLAVLLNTFRKFMNAGKDKPPAIEGLDVSGKLWNTPEIRRGESPSANGNCSARGLAKVASTMANGGTLQGKTILSPAAWKAMHAEPTDGILVSNNIKFTQGGIAQFEEEDTLVTNGRLGFYGWMGFGGSVFQWHPELKIGFGYTPTLLTWIDLVNNKARLIQGEVVRCARAVSVGV
eukprot:GFUD01038195.1.p1 GENE.GFUD01038195.1~~GFUD01038195.1.p1  ORF type:complete len:419 (+),score=109.73 GFUD01038195.1:184-1440(+)